jgi:type I restriction enzyme S subunit
MTNPITPGQQLELPSGWRWAQLGEVCEKPQYGYTASAETREVGPRLLRITDIQGGKVNWNKVPYCRCEDEVNRYILKPGDILIARTGGTTGKSYLINDVPAQAIFASYLIRVRAGKELVPEYIYQFLQSDLYWNQVEINKRGGAQPNMNASLLSELSLPLPPFPEQRRIAAKIQELMQSVDRARAACEKQLEAAKTLPAAYLREVFESEEAKRWEKKKLLEISEKFVNGGTPNTNIPHYWGGNIPWITSADITNLYVSGGRKFITQAGLNGSSTHLVKENTVLVATRTGVGKVGIASNYLCYSQDITGIICKPNILPEFLGRFLIYQSTNLTMIQRGATIKGLTRKDLESTEVLLPSVQEQQQIILYLGGKINHIDQLMSKMRNQTEKLYALPHKILKQAFRGEL